MRPIEHVSRAVHGARRCCSVTTALIDRRRVKPCWALSARRYASRVESIYRIAAGANSAGATDIAFGQTRKSVSSVPPAFYGTMTSRR
jgi:hypothetical protein